MIIAVGDDAGIVRIADPAVISTRQTTDIIAVVRDDLRHVKAMMYLPAVDSYQASYVTRCIRHDLPLRDTQMMNDRRASAFGNQPCTGGEERREYIQVINHMVASV